MKAKMLPFKDYTKHTLHNLLIKYTKITEMIFTNSHHSKLNFNSLSYIYNNV